MRAWCRTYDLVVRLTPDVALRADGTRSTNDAFRDEIEAILDRVMPDLLRPEQLIVLPASTVTDRFDWWPIAEHLAACVGQPLLAPGIERPHRRRRARAVPEALDAGVTPTPQLRLDLDDGG